jgi:hypothetical protein
MRAEFGAQQAGQLVHALAMLPGPLRLGVDAGADQCLGLRQQPVHVAQALAGLAARGLIDRGQQGASALIEAA